MFESLRRFYCGSSRMRPSPTTIVRRCSTRPLLETLEDRDVPAVFNVTRTADILNPQPSSTSHTAALVPLTAAPAQTATNRVSAGQAKQNTNIGLSLLSPTVFGAADSATSDALRIFPLAPGITALAVNPLSITNPLSTTPPTLTPFPPSGGGDTRPVPPSGDTVTQPVPPSGDTVTQPVPPSGGVTHLVPPSGDGVTQSDEPVKPAEREPGEQQEDQDLVDLAMAGLVVALVPDNDDDIAEALALVRVLDQPTALSELELLMMGMVAASTVRVAYRRNQTEEAERDLPESA